MTAADPWDEDLDVDSDELVRWSDGGWRIEDDGTANWALRKLDQKRRDIERIKENAGREVARIIAATNAAVNTLTNGCGGTEFFRAHLIDYRHRLEQNNPELPKTYRLPAGVLSRRKGPSRYVVTNEQKFIEWAERNDPDLYKRTPLVSGLKIYPHVEGAIVTRDGEPVPGVVRETDPDVYDVRPS
jgi:hypothetical protein